MSLLVIDETLCKKDGFCAGDCPMGIIRLKTNETYPQMVPGGDSICLRCGHCVAICPHGALQHVGVPMEESPRIRKDLSISHEQAVQFLRSRRSVRLFKDKPVEKMTIRRLIEIARYAPTGGNRQLVEWVVIDNRKKIREIAEQVIDWMRKVLEKDPQPASAPYMPLLVSGWDKGADTVLRNAPCLIIAMAPKIAANGMVDLTLALSYLELAAPGLDIGTCWAGLLQGALLSYKPLARFVGIPEGYPHHYPMMLGHAKPRYYRLPERKEPKITWM